MLIKNFKRDFIKQHIEISPLPLKLLDYNIERGLNNSVIASLPPPSTLHYTILSPLLTQQLDAQMLREALASRGRGKVDDIDSVEEDSDAIDCLQRPDEDEDEPNDDFFMDSAMQELRESERDGQSADDSGKDAVVAERNVCRAWVEPMSRTNEGRGRFGGKSDSSSSSSTSSSSDADRSEDRDDGHDLMTAFAKATVEEGGDTSDSSSSSTTVRPLTTVDSSKSPAARSENDHDDNFGSAIDYGDVRGGSLESAGRRGRRKAGVSKQGGVSAEVVKGARRRRRQAVKAAKDGRANGDEDDGLGCRVCGRRFPSRSKLFAHVKAEGHALLA